MDSLTNENRPILMNLTPGPGIGLIGAKIPGVGG